MPASPPTVLFAQLPWQQSVSAVHAQLPAAQRLPSWALHCGLVELVTQMPPEHAPEQHSKSASQLAPAAMQHDVLSVQLPPPPQHTLVCGPTG
ncbi:MAG: hypothetical protein ABI461_06505, partial [Polyangiaceae bacterium]